MSEETIAERYERAGREKDAWEAAHPPRAGWRWSRHESCWVPSCGQFIWIGNGDEPEGLESPLTVFVSEDGSGEIRYVTDDGRIILDPPNPDDMLLNPGEPGYDAALDPRVNGSRDVLPWVND